MQAFSFSQPDDRSSSTQHGTADAALQNGSSATPGDPAAEDRHDAEPRSEQLCAICLAPLSPDDLSRSSSSPPNGLTAEQLEQACCRSCRQQILRPMKARRLTTEHLPDIADLLPTLILGRIRRGGVEHGCL